MNIAKKADRYTYELSPLTLAKAFWNGKLVAVAVALVLSTIGITIVRQLPAVYRAEAVILVDSQKIPERFVSSTVTAEVQDRLTTISQELLSSTRLAEVMQDFDLYRKERETRGKEEVLEIMRRDIELKVDRIGGGGRPGAFRISYQGPDRAVVASVANQIANLYIEENLRTREVQAEGTSEFITHQLDEAKKQLDTLEASVSQYKIRNNGQLPQQESTLMGVLGRLQTELHGVQEGINRAEETKLILQSSLSAAETAEDASLRALQSRPTTSAETSIESMSTVPSRPVSRVAQITAQLGSLRNRYSDEHPEVRRAIRELERARLAENRKNAENEATETAAPVSGPRVPRLSEADPTALIQLAQARDRTAMVRAQVAANERELSTRRGDRARILKEMAAYQSRVESLPLREQEMAALTRDYEMSKERYRSLLDKKIAADMATELERRQKGEKFTILDPARAPERPYKPNRPVFYAASLAAGIALGFVCAIGKGLMHDHLLGEWELPKDIVLLGRVPHIDLKATTPSGLRARLRL